MSGEAKITHHVASGKARLRHVFVKDLKVDASLGIYPEEKTKPQRIIVNIDLSVREAVIP
jgi:dihydroneopterin aldolase